MLYDLSVYIVITVAEVILFDTSFQIFDNNRKDLSCKFLFQLIQANTSPSVFSILREHMVLIMLKLKKELSIVFKYTDKDQCKCKR